MCVPYADNWRSVATALNGIPAAVISPPRVPSEQSSAGSTATLKQLEATHWRRSDLAASVVAIEPYLQLVAIAVLAAWPWLHAFGKISVDASWRPWLAAVGLHAIWLQLRPYKQRFLAVFALLGLGGVLLSQALEVYLSIVQAGIQLDYWLLVSRIRHAAFDPFSNLPNLWMMQPFNGMLQVYFDPLTPLINRVLDLTHDPFRLLGFHTLMIFSAPLVVLWLTSRHPQLRAFQFALPVALLVHPALSLSMESDYHSSEVAVGLLLLGTYYFFSEGTGRQWKGFLPLLAGTLIKISYWPSFLMFGPLSALRRRWLWAVMYVGTGVVALVLHSVLVRGGAAGGFFDFFSKLGNSPSQVIYNAIFHPSLWAQQVLLPERWLFYVLVLLPLGFCVIAYPLAIVPALPLLAFAMLDGSGFRSMMIQYATEYLGYFVGGALVGLTRVSNWMRLAILILLAVGMPVSFNDATGFVWPRMTVRTAVVVTQDYFQEARFSECAVGSAPVLTTDIQWVTYIREYPDHLWYDGGGNPWYAPGRARTIPE